MHAGPSPASASLAEWSSYIATASPRRAPGLHEGSFCFVQCHLPENPLGRPCLFRLPSPQLLPPQGSFHSAPVVLLFLGVSCNKECESLWRCRHLIALEFPLGLLGLDNSFLLVLGNSPLSRLPQCVFAYHFYTKRHLNCF